MSRRVGWPPWWYWELIVSSHAQFRINERGITEIDFRRMLERAGGWTPSVVPGRFTIRTTHRKQPWLVIVEPDLEEHALVVVTAFEYLP